MRVSGADYSGTDYTGYGYYMGSVGAGNWQHVNTTAWVPGAITTTEPIWGSMDIYAPNVAAKTNFSNLTGIAPSIYSNGRLNTTTQYTGFTMLPTAGTITGTVKVYGYSNS
jgi:hypothetical protein